MSAFDTTLDAFTGTGAISDSWELVSGYAAFSRANDHAAYTTYPAFMYWNTVFTANGNVWVTLYDILSGTYDEFWLAFRLQTPGGVVDGYVVKFVNQPGNYTNWGAELYRANDLSTALDTLDTGISIFTVGDSMGVEFADATFTIKYKPVGEAAVTLGSFTDSGIDSTGYIGLAFTVGGE